MSTAIFWFRQDLRCTDNPALTLACSQHSRLILVYIKEPNAEVTLGSAQKWWLHHTLSSLKNTLLAKGMDLALCEAEPLALFKQLIAEHQVEAVYWNRCYEPVRRARDAEIKSALKNQNIQVVSCNGSLLHEPWEVQNQQGHYFKVFTPYWRQCVRQMAVRPILEITQWPAHISIPSVPLERWALLPKNPNWAVDFSTLWQPGEAGAHQKLQYFLQQHLTGYKDARNEPSRAATSHLSPHLHFGEISPHYVWLAVQEAMRAAGTDLPSAQTFLTELGWREFSYHLLYHFPQLMDTPFKKAFADFPWQEDEEALKHWQQGRTGYPIVDAGMRELWHTGYMHNRVRMIVASFLTKDLLIDWRKGAAWFLDTLVDADLASNSASWQWVAGSGVDAAPYYRIFNPSLQGSRFDPQGSYVRRWVPELQSVPEKWIHQPWMAPKGALPITLGVDYPLPMVNHDTARVHALALYKALAQ